MTLETLVIKNPPKWLLELIRKRQEEKNEETPIKE